MRVDRYVHITITITILHYTVIFIYLCSIQYSHCIQYNNYTVIHILFIYTYIYYSFLREGGTRRKLEFQALINTLEMMNSIHAFLSLYTTEILTILDVHSVIIYNNNVYTDYTVYGDSSIIPTIEGYDILNKRCKMNSIYPSNKFEQYLEGNGAGCIFFKNNYITIACIRRCLYRYLYCYYPTMLFYCT